MLKQPLNHQEYSQLAERNQSTLVQMLNTRGPAFKKLGVRADQLDEQQALELLTDNPRLLKRPILVRGNQLLSGFKEEEYRKFLN